MSLSIFTKSLTLILFLPTECNKFVVSEMNFSKVILTKLMGFSFSQKGNPFFAKHFVLVLLLILFHAAFIQDEADNLSILVESSFSLSSKLAIKCFTTSWQYKALKLFYTPKFNGWQTEVIFWRKKIVHTLLNFMFRCEVVLSRKKRIFLFW